MPVTEIQKPVQDLYIVSKLNKYKNFSFIIKITNISFRSNRAPAKRVAPSYPGLWQLEKTESKGRRMGRKSSPNASAKNYHSLVEPKGPGRLQGCAGVVVLLDGIHDLAVEYRRLGQHLWAGIFVRLTVHRGHVRDRNSSAIHTLSRSTTTVGI